MVVTIVLSLIYPNFTRVLRSYVALSPNPSTDLITASLSYPFFVTLSPHSLQTSNTAPPQRQRLSRPTLAMRPSLAQSARLLAEADIDARTRGATIAYEICLARCVAPITPLAPVQVALGRDFAVLAPVLRRLARALRTPPSDKARVDLVIAAARALAAVAALLVFAQRCDVHSHTLAHIAHPLRLRCAPALVAPLLATDLRVVAAARDALDQIVLLRVAHTTPWIDVLLALRTFRTHYTAAAAAANSEDAPQDKNSLLSIVLVRTSALLRNVFIEATRDACNPVTSDVTPNDSPEVFRANSWLRRRSSVSNAAPPVRVSAMSSWRGAPRESEPILSDRRSIRFIDRLRHRKRKNLSSTRDGNMFAVRCDDNGCVSSEPDSFDSPPVMQGMKFSKRPIERANQEEGMPVEPDSLGSRISLDSARNMPRRSVELGKMPRGRRDMTSEGGNGVKRIQSYRRKKRHGGADLSASFTSEILNAAQWNGRQLGVKNREVSAAMHVYERLLSRELLPNMQDRCEVIDDLHRLVDPLLSGTTAEQRNVNPEALRCIVANAFLAHGSAIYPALLALIFRPAPSLERTEIVKRQMSLQPKNTGNGIQKTDTRAGKLPRRSRRYRANDFSLNILESTSSTLQLAQLPDDDRRKNEDSNKRICLPNSECDSETAIRCCGLLSLLVTDVPMLCNPRLPLITGTTNSAYWHCAEALVEKGGRGKMEWAVDRLFGAVQSLFLLNSSLPATTEQALECITDNVEQLDSVIETCMRSVCASGCRLARNDARDSEPSLSDTGVIQSAKAWATLSGLPSQSVLWPTSQAYSSAIVFIAHLARRTAVTVYRQKQWEQFEMEEQRFGIAPVVMDNSFDPHTPLRRRGEAGPSSTRRRDENNEATMHTALQNCIGIMVNRNGSSVIVHDLFRTLLYIIGCELRGSPTRASFSSHNDEMAVASGNVMSRSSVKVASLPSRAPFFARSGQSPQSDTREAYSLGAAAPAARVNGPMHESASCSDVDIVDVQSLNRLSLDESDMSGLLVGNIAVDGSRDCKLRNIAAKAEGNAVASWFTGVGPPVGHSIELRSVPNTTPCDEELFEEFATAAALVLNSVSTAAAVEAEDVTVAMDKVADDVAKSSSGFVMGVHERALALLKEAKLGSAKSVFNPTVLVQQVKSLRSEVGTLKQDVDTLKGALAAMEENWKRFRWPLRSFPRNTVINEMNQGSDQNSLKRSSVV